MLTVIREAAEAANEAARTGRADLNEVMAATVAAAQQSLERTPMLLQVLRDAGVVDAGGQGLVIILEAIAAEWRGEAWQEPTTKTEALPRARLDAVESEFGYCTEFLIRGQRLNLDEIRERIGALGDSLLVVGDEQLVRVHVHTHDPGAALSYAVQRGDLLDIKIDNMQDQNERFRARQRDSLEAPAATVAQPVAPAPAVSAPVAASPASGRPMPRLRTSTTLERVKLSTGVVAVAAGPGLAEVFLSLGAHKVFDCGAAMNPSTEEMLTAIAEMDADVAIILPNNPNIVMTALQAQEHATKRVMVIPSKSMPQGIAAMMKYNPDRTASENEAAMRQAIENVRTIEVARAVRDARVDGTAVKAGEVMAVGDEGLLATAPDETAAIKAALARLDREAYAVATLYYGDSVDASTAQQLIGVLRETYPDLEFEAVWGGQPHYSYLIAVE
jgi:DAK2 domain fusion protein YloV